ncbi:MAG: phosphoesterase [Campylobacterota bacterium]|nr:phosphoesterase [Campylobacterota bacterium]
MQIPIDKISQAKHILLICDNSSFGVASALYTYVLTLHKKVSISSAIAIEKRLSFMPWYDKVRCSSSSSADLVIEVENDIGIFFDLLDKDEIKINKKMATALYGALLMKYDFFKSSECDGMVFAWASQLIALGAEYKTCREYLQKRESLSSIRLKATLYKTLLLKENATQAELYISDEELKASGSYIEDVYPIMKEVLNIVNVEEVTLIKSDENSKIVKQLKEI